MIQKILDDHELEFDGYTDKCCISKTELSEILKEYAILMCRKQKEICAEEGKLNTGDFPSKGVNRDSILNSSLPKELQDEN